jgi:phosphatidylserine/phosphatidylglycerophosphate/cardiolipin synthase-like enzyme
VLTPVDRQKYRIRQSSLPPPQQPPFWIIGKVAATAGDLPHEPYPGKRLHVRAMIRDGRDAFVGSQSLRKLELDKRREVGVLLKHPAVVHELAAIFEEDWALTESGQHQKKKALKSTPSKPTKTRGRSPRRWRLRQSV